MFNLLAVRSDPLPRLTRLISDPSTPAHQKMVYQDQLVQEQTKGKRGAVENALRRNNLLPVVFELFKAMGESGKLGELPNLL